jgi:hypothetical protein
MCGRDRAKEIDHSEDFEVLEITMPADCANSELK